MILGRRTLRALVAAVLALAGTRAWAQCSMCQSVVSQSPEAQAAAAELNRAILVLFVAPYLVFAALLLLFFREPLARLFFRVAGHPLPR